MYQELTILALFIAALVYLGIVLRRSFRSESGCAKNCGCDTSDSRQAIKSS